jgi:opacity protein-like surface antigen
MKHLIYIAALTMIPVVMFAQQKSFDDEVNSELDRMYEQKGKPVQVAQADPVQVVQQPVAAVPVQVVQQPQTLPTAQAVNAPTTVQVQRTTIVEATPLTDSKADRLRKSREEEEAHTEQKIVEKLETSRMEVLFGDNFNSLSSRNDAPVAVAAVVAQPAAPVAVAVVAAPAPVAVVAAPIAKENKEDSGPRLDRSAVKEEIRAALDEDKAKNESKGDDRHSYIAVTGGMDDYNNSNIKAEGSVGILYGQRINDHFYVEGQFNYADNHIQQPYGLSNGSYGGQYPAITDMQSYQGLVEAKYSFLRGVFRPMVGVAGAYTYRHYNDIQFGYAGDTGSSNAIDAGLVVGADAQVSESFAIGLEYRYMWNIVNQEQTNSGLQQDFNYSYNNLTPENMGYGNVSLVARFTF